ncbi:hypothetical protein CCHR01_01509 [Colletotrichum chrysophilum]|uniref:Uncharacterized protein n=1 Tax=Colletotrichum chrysophilum TaxID=1836956 RepID=A0AAD9AWC6_9PEZI|nr:hypothetical protein CCHR01_01509 [Colletotrichum chrysophilum]
MKSLTPDATGNEAGCRHYCAATQRFGCMNGSCRNPVPSETKPSSRSPLMYQVGALARYFESASVLQCLCVCRPRFYLTNLLSGGASARVVTSSFIRPDIPNQLPLASYLFHRPMLVHPLTSSTSAFIHRFVLLLDVG